MELNATFGRKGKISYSEKKISKKLRIKYYKCEKISYIKRNCQ